MPSRWGHKAQNANDHTEAERSFSIEDKLEVFAVGIAVIIGVIGAFNQQLAKQLIYETLLVLEDPTALTIFGALIAGAVILVVGGLLILSLDAILRACLKHMK